MLDCVNTSTIDSVGYWKMTEFLSSTSWINTRPSPAGETVTQNDAGAIRLNLGCGDDILPGFVHHDVRRHRPEVDVAHDLRVLPWPWPDDCAEEIRLFDVLEHLPEVVPALDECWRLLRPGGVLHLRVPHYQHENTWLDPTHRRGFHLESFDYFDPDTRWGSKCGFYTERKWRLLRRELTVDGNVAASLRPRKDVRLDEGGWRACTESERSELARKELTNHISAGYRYLLIQWDHWGEEDWVPGRQAVPFLERDGEYWGPPPDEVTAIREFDRLRRSGVSFLVVVWPAFWWLERYPALFCHLRALYRCVLDNDRVVVFDLRV
jgi:SAM-dependent methyltransferase